MNRYETRFDFIQPHVTDRAVIDVGPAELIGTVNREKYERWTHRRIKEVASSLVGVELNSEQVKALSGLGFDIREGDAEDFDLDLEVEVVFAGELIEHLSNPGLFLDCALRHLQPGGKLVLTTPNRFGIDKVIHVARSGRIPRYRKAIAKHVMYFDSDSLTSLLERHGFVDVTIDYGKWVGARGTRRRRALLAITGKLRPVMLPVLLATASKPIA